MRRIENRIERGLDQFLLIDDAGEIPELIQRHRITASGGWYGASGEELARKAATGDESLVAESERFISEIEDQMPVSPAWRRVDDVVGGVPNVPAFLAGHPQHMRRRQRTARENAPLAIYMDLTSSAAIEARDVQRRGVVLLALTRMLVEHRPVELWVGTSKGARGLSGTVAWRIDTAPLDLARSSYHIGATAMARGFGYGVDNRLNRTGGGWPMDDYDWQCRTGEARMRAAIGLGDMLYVPPVASWDPLMGKPVKWLREKMRQYLGGEE